MISTPQDIKELLATLKADRSNWESNWQETVDYTVPNKNDFNRTPMDGEKKGVMLFDSTAIHSNQMLAGALHGMLTNPSSYWFGLSVGDNALDRDDKVRLYLDKAMRKIHLVLNNSNFQTEIHETYIDLGSAGTSLLYIEPDDELKIRFSTMGLSHCYIMENNKGMVDVVLRCFKFTHKQAYQEWGDELPEDLIKLAKDKPNEKQEFIHAVFPREKSNKSGNPKKMRYASQYLVEHKGKMKLLSESGYRTFPYAVPRWSKSSGEIYGRSPAMNALADIKMVNRMMQTTLEGAEKTVNPPLMAPDDGFVRKVKLTPAGVNYYRAGSQDRIEPLLTNARVDFGYQAVEDVRTRIRSAFFVDQLQLNQGPQMTATEVMQRTEEKLRLMGPVLGRQHAELLKPLIERVFDILQEKGEFGPPPAILVNRKVTVNYTSAIAKVQMSSEIQNVQKALAALAPLVQVDPSVMDLVDMDETGRFILEKSSLPQPIIRNSDGVESIRRGRAQAQQEQQAQQNQLTQSEIAKNTAGAAAAVSKSMVPAGA